jgi:hypothetical protein
VIKNNVEKIINSILNDFQKVRDPDVLQTRRETNSMYKRFFTLLYLTVLGSYIIYNYNSYVLTYLPKGSIIITIIGYLSIMGIVHYKAFYIRSKAYKGPLKSDASHMFGMHTHTKEYNIAFWILALILLFFYWIILIRPHIFFMESEVLWNYLITIKKIYTVEEKIIYLYQYFDVYTNQIPYIALNQIENIRHIIRHIDFSTMINENTTIETIRNYVKTLPELYVMNESMIQEHNQKLVEVIEKHIKHSIVLEKRMKI